MILLANISGMISLILFLPLCGILSDYFGNGKCLVMAGICLIAFAYPSFYVLQHFDIVNLYLIEILYGFFIAFYTASAPAFCAELFETNIRFSGVALGLNIAATFFGGTAPLLAIWLVKVFSETTLPGIYLMIATIISLLFIILYLNKPNLFPRPSSPSQLTRRGRLSRSGDPC